MPETKFRHIPYPKKSVYLAESAPFDAEALGTVRTKIAFPTIDPDHDTEELCANAFNQGAHDLLRKAKKDYGATAIVRLRSVVFYLDGTKKTYPQAECADEGDEGQILMQALAVRPKRKRKIGEAAAPPASPATSIRPLPADEKSIDPGVGSKSDF